MFLKFAKFQKVRTERNKRLLNMSATLRRRCQTSLGAGSRCKGSELFWIEQEKSLFRCDFLFSERAIGATV